MRHPDWTSGQPQLLVRTCQGCGARWYLPHTTCRRCHHDQVVVSAARGGGTCLARSLVRPSGDAMPYALVLVELLEGPTVMARATDDIRPGHQVTVEFHEVTGALLPVFRSANG